MANKKAARQQRQEKAKKEIEKFGGFERINNLAGKVEDFRKQRQAKNNLKIVA